MGKTYFNYKFPKQTFQSKYSDNKQFVKNPLKVPELDHIWYSATGWCSVTNQSHYT